MLTFLAWRAQRRYGCAGPTLAMRGNARRRELMAQVRARTWQTMANGWWFRRDSNRLIYTSPDVPT